jgi:23S rRNA (uridine2479-2'-O)-methyltransferase
VSPKIVRVTSEDQVFIRLSRLKHSQHARHTHGEFFVEGVKSIDQARRHGWPIRSLVYAAGRRLSRWAQETLSGTHSATWIELAPTLMEALSDKNQVSELIAVAAMPGDSPSRIRLGRRGLVIVVERPSSPGNLGSIVRSSHALGSDGVFVTGHGTDVYHPLTVRAGMGSLFALPVVRFQSHKDVARWLKETPTLRVIGLSSDATKPLDAVDLTGPTLLVLGNEAEGISPGYRAMCQELVRIPMYGGADSVNVACAAAVALYEVDRQRRRLLTARRERTLECASEVEG